MSKWSEIWKPGSFVVVHLNFRQGAYTLSAATIHKNKKDEVPEEFDSVESLIKKMGKSKVYCLHVTGSGVLTRLTEFVSGYKEQLIVNADKDDFYFTSWNDGNQVLVSFFRKNLLEPILEEMLAAKIFLADISCGIVPTLLTCQADDTVNYDYTVKLENGRISQCFRNELPNEKSVIGGVFKERYQSVQEGIYNSQLNPIENYSSGLTTEEHSSNIENYIQFSRFRFSGLTLVGTVLTALMINYFYLNHLNNEVVGLEEKLALNTNNLSLLDKLNQEKVRKELLVQSSGVSQQQYLSFYVDKIGETVPKVISFQAMNLFPLKESLKEKRKVEIEQSQIEIIGTTPDSEVLDDWMERMNRFDWVKSVELVNYLKNEGLPAEFKLVITLAQ